MIASMSTNRCLSRNRLRSDRVVGTAAVGHEKSPIEPVVDAIRGGDRRAPLRGGARQQATSGRR
jgi:hypothetical protein